MADRSAHWSGPNGIPIRLGEHIAISAASLVIAIAIALPLGLYIGHTGRGTRYAINSANVWRALPSLAVIAIVLPFTAALDPQAGFKIWPTVIAMVVLAAPPILVNAYAGVSGVDRDLVEAGRGQGMSALAGPSPGRAAAGRGGDRHRSPIGRGADHRHGDAGRRLWLRRSRSLHRRRICAERRRPGFRRSGARVGPGHLDGRALCAASASG